MAKKCTHCNTSTSNHEMQGIPLISAECETTRQHEVIKRLLLVIVLLITFLFGSNLAWVVYNCRFETVKESYDIELEQETEYGNNCIVNGGESSNGEAESEN